MAFVVQLGVTKDPKNKISKTFTNVESYNCVVKSTDGVNIMTPELSISTGTVVGKNYAHIPDFNRYYFIKSATVNPNGIWTVVLDEDVLMSNRFDLYNSTAKLARSADYRNLYLPDSQLPVTKRTLTFTRPFPNSPFDGRAHGGIITIAGPKG